MDDKEKKYIDEFIAYCREFCHKYRIVHFRQKTFYGKVEFNFQDGEWTYSGVHYTEK